MYRLTSKELERTNYLIKQGKSLKKIATEMGRSKTTIYYHFRKIKGKTVKPIVVNSEDEEAIGEFIGLFAGDGSSYTTKSFHYRVFLHFNISEKEFVDDLVKNVLMKLFGKRPMIFRQENCLNLVYYSKEIQKLVNEHLTWNKSDRKTYSIRLKHSQQSKEFIIGFIRGSLDSDGYFSKDKISFASVSKCLIDNISNFLSELDIIHSVYFYKEKRHNRRDMYHIYVSRKDRKKFIELIKPRNV